MIIAIVDDGLSEFGIDLERAPFQGCKGRRWAESKVSQALAKAKGDNPEEWNWAEVRTLLVSWGVPVVDCELSKFHV